MKSLFALALIAFVTSFGPFARAEESSMNDGTKNFRFDPIFLLLGAVNVHLDFKVNNEWTVGPELTAWKFSGDFNTSSADKYDVTLFSGGIRGNWFKNGTFNDGLYLAPFASYYNIDVTVNSSSSNSANGKASGVSVGGLVGYGWFWKSFNQMLGAGLSSVVGDHKATVTDASGVKEDVDTPRTGFTFEYTLGWTF